MVSRLFISLVIGSFFFVGAAAHAAPLTNEQVTAILSLLRSFGAEAEVVTRVEKDLRGESAQCPTLQYPLFRGSTDTTTAGEVSWVQDFLAVALPHGFYGPLTEEAVRAFQIRENIVVSGTPEKTGFGVVGPLTRARLQEVCNESKNVGTARDARPPEDATQDSMQTLEEIYQPTPLSFSTPLPPGTEPNTVNADYFRAVIQTLGTEQGMTSAELQRIDAVITETLESDEDINATFQNEVIANDNGSGGGISRAISILALSGAATLAPALISQATAALTAPLAPGVPFGATNHYFSFPCTCSGTWLLIFPPLPPSFPTALSYVPGTQLFASYNLPLGRSIVGTYTPPGICFAGPTCQPIPSQGMILPVTGSSPI
jgi:peptidoglycan hydrolase-like protein with peptidoglycan-binding domain